jgi:hypothetical protein
LKIAGDVRADSKLLSLTDRPKAIAIQCASVLRDAGLACKRFSLAFFINGMLPKMRHVKLCRTPPLLPVRRRTIPHAGRVMVNFAGNRIVCGGHRWFNSCLYGDRAD